jgi:hypothetical protein
MKRVALTVLGVFAMMTWLAPASALADATFGPNPNAKSRGNCLGQQNSRFTGNGAVISGQARSDPGVHAAAVDSFVDQGKTDCV